VACHDPSGVRAPPRAVVDPGGRPPGRSSPGLPWGRGLSRRPRACPGCRSASSENPCGWPLRAKGNGRTARESRPRTPIRRDAARPGEHSQKSYDELAGEKRADSSRFWPRKARLPPPWRPTRHRRDGLVQARNREGRPITRVNHRPHVPCVRSGST
jgi:hypothetical protein